MFHWVEMNTLVVFESLQYVCMHAWYTAGVLIVCTFLTRGLSTEAMHHRGGAQEQSFYGEEGASSYSPLEVAVCPAVQLLVNYFMHLQYWV